MPVPIAAKAGVIAITVAAAAAIAVYESPELRRMVEDLRRRVAVALHSFGDRVAPDPNVPVFNRPEDADGFMQSRGVAGADAGVVADEASRRRQREELMYWNAVRAEKKEEERRAAEKAAAANTASYQPNPDRSTYVFNTGADVQTSANSDNLLVRRRAPEGVRGLNASVYVNPFGDEHGIDADEAQRILAPGPDEMSDIYDATERGEPTAESALLARPETAVPAPPVPEVLFEFDAVPVEQNSTDPQRPRLEPEEYMTAGQDYDHATDAYASIQAWAQGSSPGFYSPLPLSPEAPMSEPEIISAGALTPTDSASVAGSGVDVGVDLAEEARSPQSSQEVRYYDVLSDDDGEGMATPASWTEVGSVVSENEGNVHA